MQKTELLVELKKLQNDVEETTDLDNETRRVLHGLLGDIQQKLSPAGSGTTSSEEETLSQKLLKAVSEFEVQHPQLTATLSQLVDRLSDMGI